MEPTKKVALSLPLFPFVRGEVLPTTSSPPHLIVFSTLLCLMSYFYSLPPLLPSSSLLTQSSHLSIDLPRLLLPCSRNSAAHPPSFQRVLPTVVKLLRAPVSSLNSTILLLYVCPRHSCYQLFSYPLVFAHLQPLLL